MADEMYVQKVIDDWTPRDHFVEAGMHLKLVEGLGYMNGGTERADRHLRQAHIHALLAAISPANVRDPDLEEKEDYRP